MFHSIRGLQDVSEDYTASACQAALASLAINPLNTSMASVAFSPSCVATAYQGAVYGGTPNAPQGASLATSSVPSQATIDSFTPDQVALYEQQTQQQNATGSAQTAIQSAVDSGTYDPVGNLPTLPNIPGLPNASLPSTTLLIGLCVAGGLVIFLLAKK